MVSFVIFLLAPVRNENQLFGLMNLQNISVIKNKDLNSPTSYSKAKYLKKIGINRLHFFLFLIFIKGFYPHG